MNTAKTKVRRAAWFLYPQEALHEMDDGFLNSLSSPRKCLTRIFYLTEKLSLNIIQFDIEQQVVFGHSPNRTASLTHT